MEQQYRQIKTLLELESQFVEILNTTRYAPTVYQSFMNHICNVKQNISAARPYFRESKGTFAKKISPIFKARDHQALQAAGLRFNCKFVGFAVRHRSWNKSSPLLKKYNEIQKLRAEIVELNLPLAVSQAKAFWRATPESHLSFMDVVQIQVQGLLSGVDKFLPQDRKNMSHAERLASYRKFRPTAIGFMARDRMASYSQCLLHFPTSERKVLYRTNKLARQFDENDLEGLTEAVNLYLTKTEKVQSETIGEILASRSVVSVIQQHKNGAANEVHLDELQHSSVEFSDPVSQIEITDATASLAATMHVLNVLEHKLLQLKGIRL